MSLVIRRLEAPDVPAFLRLRRRALVEEPTVFLADPATDRALQSGFTEDALGDREHQAIFGAHESDEIVGCVGLVRPTSGKSSHRATLWGMYVAPEARGRGAGRRLVDAVIACARDWGALQVVLCVSETAPGARHIYETAGFRAWGREPSAMLVDGRLYDEDHMTLLLR